MRLPGTGPTAQEHTALMHELGALPIRGMAWPTWTKVVVLLVLILIAAQLFSMATGPASHHVSHAVAAILIAGFLALVVAARFMMISETQVTEAGIEQSWFSRRHVAWDDIQYAKFIPLLASKRLVCFTATGRPVIFQAGTRPLSIAFARIAIVYRRRPPGQ